MAKENESAVEQQEISREELKSEILNDYRIALESREASLLGRREVLTGKAKFGIFGDGKEVAQIAMAKQFKEGDWRSGYYRDQTFMLAIGQLTIEQFFAQLYAHTDLQHDPHSAGRQMNSHFATRSLNDDGTWKNLTEIKNTSPDMSPTASQMPRLLGLAYASKFYRENENLSSFGKFSKNGNEVAFGTIGDASTSEGMFWEAINAAGVLQIPMLVSVWDDGHGISVPKKYQTTKENISDILSGFQRDERSKGWEIMKVNGWDYASLCLVYEEAANIAREEHVPVLVHVEEMTQPQGHSTSGSHERYKSKERLEWEKEYDCIKKMREWILQKGIAQADELEKIEAEAKSTVRNAKNAAWKNFLEPIKNEIAELNNILDSLIAESSDSEKIAELKNSLAKTIDPLRREVMETARIALRLVRAENIDSRYTLAQWLDKINALNTDRYSSHLYSQSEFSPMSVEEIKPEYSENSPLVDGREIIRDNFDVLLSKHPELLIFGEDAGKIGGVNQGLEGMQAKYGELRVFDTGIRETTIIGQGIGLALRGMRPIAEIQYLDYLMYALQTMSDDLATIQYRTKGGQKAPLIIRTRGHRLEGIWHSGSQLGTIINAIRGIHVCVPRNMTQAAGMYNTLLKGDDPGLVIESLNGYRLKEKLPSNIGEYTIPLGIPEILKEGEDITIVSYGSTVRMVLEAANQLAEMDISAEVIDVQTLLPFDINGIIASSVQKTSKVLFIDEDVPGGASAYMMQQVLEIQNAYRYLDAEPKTLTGKAHRPAYGTDGDYFSKPSIDDMVEATYSIMNEYNPEKYPSIY
jgi:2-oxoisovalerate dehydrogenase E1 component